MTLRLGKFEYDLSNRSLVMGILNRTTDSFFDQGAYFGFSDFLKKAEALVEAGADILDVGGVKAGVGDEISTSEEIDRVVPAIKELVKRFDVAVSVDTWNTSVLEESLQAGAVLGNDISGFADRQYLDIAAKYGAAVVATHIRLAPRVPDLNPIYDDVVSDVTEFLDQRTKWAISAGVKPNSIVIDAGLDLGKTTEQSLELLRNSSTLCELGFTLLLSASNKDFLGEYLNLELNERRPASISAALVAYLGGARIFRVHDVKGHRRALDMISEINRRASIEVTNAESRSAKS